MSGSRKRFLKITLKIITDVVSLFLAGLAWIVLEVIINKPYVRGFFCNDESIRRPYLGNTVDYVTMVLASMAAAFLVVVICETVLHYCSGENEDIPNNITTDTYLPYFLVCIYRYFGIFGFGVLVQQSIVNIGKYSIGRLRPHFLDVCKPDISKLHCTVPNIKEDIFVYVTNYTCASDVPEDKIIQARLSFPSGHSAYVVYVVIYFVIYLQARWTWRYTMILKHLCQALLVYTALWVCLSRITDNKHHPSDVFAGASIGCAVAAFLGVHATRLFTLKSILARLKYHSPPVFINQQYQTSTSIL